MSEQLPWCIETEMYRQFVQCAQSERHSLAAPAAFSLCRPLSESTQAPC